VLAHVAASEGQTQQTLADSLLVTKGNVCQLLGRMERLGLIERQQEGRSNRLYLTDKGRALFQEIVPDHEATVAGCFSSLDSDEQKTLLRLLRKVDQSLEWSTRADD
jgi:DNA-binding MarR family transcriptional regulator